MSFVGIPRNKDNYDEVEIYRMSDLMRYDPVRLSVPGLVFTAILGGGDYDPNGLEGVTVDTAYRLAGSNELIRGLWEGVKGDNGQPKLEQWRDALRNELTTNSQHLLKTRRPLVATYVTEHFPDTEIVRRYTDPLTTHCPNDGGPSNRVSNWGTRLPDMAALTKLICEHWNWNWQELYNFYRKSVWPGTCIRQLLEPELAARKARSECLDHRSLHKIYGCVEPRPEGLSFDVYKIRSSITGVLVPAIKAFMSANCLEAPPSNSHIIFSQLQIPAPVIDYMVPKLAESTSPTSTTAGRKRKNIESE
ncbi:hypothetical protein CC1G_13378 [Coprinopsis cinerea okayama7|uniref:Uncharacterized protein n=1 Tax=Coprinopsis cinerea (strain Okayama-7 / 130 / ATCC MYA-4618 / FGSC 9003) TaxID=240176 RepID=A8NZ85_COPC7|nr:hypothetical protein CC1G_13378 [Coprinopsis cinerea okayama7\|eukprot:XP_001837630.1 hypothetical protein CC1G_13378 [Coprinopsis cinerea okayama7\